MADFRIKLFGLAAIATVFAGVSFGQVTCTNAALGGNATTITLRPASPLLLRAESQTELVSDAVLSSCTGATSSGQLTVFASVPVTSKAITGITGVNSEAALQVFPTSDASGAPSSVYAGTVSGSTVSFANVTFPATFSLVISNIRVNASATAAGASPVAVTETIFAGSNGQATVNFINQNVGYALKSLATPAFTLKASGSANITNYVVCTGNPLAASTTTAPSTSFTIIAAETFGGFFKVQGAQPATPQNSEAGSYTGTFNNAAGAAGVGVAATATQIALALGNVPSVATVYVPITISYTPAGGVPASIQLVNTQTPVTGPSNSATTGTSLLPTSGGGYTFGGWAALTPSSGALTATYQVINSSAAQVETFQIPVIVTMAANASSAQSAITVLESYSPTGTVSGPAAAVPTFLATTNTPLNGSTISVCVTNLMFPFITNQVGYDTGIVLANTSTDPFTSSLGAATPQSGTCTLNFYGQGGPAAPVVYPSTGTIASGQAPAFVLSSVAPGFQGYMIAQCQFLYGHGFAFLTNAATAGNSGVAQGYVAGVMSGRGIAAGSTVESIGQ